MHVVQPHVEPGGRADAPAETITDAAAERTPQAPRRARIARLRHPDIGPTCLSLAVLLVAVSLSLADGLLGDVVAYERDTTVFYFPLMAWVAQQLHAGVLPLWTPQVFGGYPIFADGEIGLAYPPMLLALWLLAPERAFVFMRLLHLWIAAVGTFWLARVWGLPRRASVLAGLVFALGNFLQAQIHHENIVRTAAWLPVILVLLELALRSSRGSSRACWTVLAALALGMAGLGLHSQMLAIDLLALAGYGMLRWWAGPLWSLEARRLLRPVWARRFGAVALVCLPAIMLGLGLAAVQLVPLVELAGFSPRGSGIPYSESAAYSLTPYGLVQLIFPFVFRGPGGLQWGLWTHWESYLYVGLAPLILAAIGLARVRRREVVGWAVLAGVGAIVALGQYSPLNLHYLLWLLPGLSGLRAPGRFTIIVVLALAMLAAYGLAWLQDHAAHFESRRVAQVWAAAGAAGLALAVVAAHGAFVVWSGLTQAAIDVAYLSLSRDSYPLTQADVYAGLLWATDLGNPRVAIALGGLLVLAGLLGAWRFGIAAVRRWPGWPSVVVAFAALDLLVFAWGIHPRTPLENLAFEPRAIRALHQLAGQSPDPPRVLASPVLNQVSADRLAPLGVQDVNGYSSLQFVWHRDYLTRVLEVDDNLLDLWGVRYVVDPAAFGTLPTYRGVEFLPAQALLHSPAGSAMSEQTFALSGGTNVSELRIVSVLMGALNVPQDAPVAELELRDANNAIVAQTELRAGRDTMEWAWDSPSVRPFMRHERVEVAGLAFDGVAQGAPPRVLSYAALHLEQPVAATTLVIRAVPPTGELAILGGGVVDNQGHVQQLFGRTKAKYRLAYADAEMRVFENTAALPRAFLVSQARSSPSIGTSLGEMSHRPFDPRQEVVIAADAAADVTQRLDAGPRLAAGSGSAEIVAYSSNQVRVHASSSGTALLLVTDTFYPGWRAFVDGQEQPLVRGDLLFRVVPIGPGEHDVELRFEPTSVRIGMTISLGALAIGLGVLVLAGRVRRRGRTT